MLHLVVEENLELRTPEASDAEAFFAIFTREREYLSQWADWPTKLQTLEDCKRYVESYQQCYEAKSCVPLVILYQNQLVGLCTLDIKNWVVRNAELSYWIAEGYQKQGIVTKSCKVLITYAFSQLGLNRIFLRFKHVSHERENRRSRLLAERLGFIEEGVEREGGATKGEFMDMVCYSLLADEWRRSDKYKPSKSGIDFLKSE